MVGYKMKTTSRGRQVHIVGQIVRCDLRMLAMYPTEKHVFNDGILHRGIVLNLPNGSLTAYDCGYIQKSLAVFAAYGPSEEATKKTLKKFMESVGATDAGDDRITRRTAEYYKELDMHKIEHDRDDQLEDDQETLQ